MDQSIIYPWFNLRLDEGVVDEVLLVVARHRVESDVHRQLEGREALGLTARGAFLEPSAAGTPRPGAAQVVSAKDDGRDHAHVNTLQVLADGLASTDGANQIITLENGVLALERLKRISGKNQAHEFFSGATEGLFFKPEAIVDEQEPPVGEVTPQIVYRHRVGHLEFVASRHIQKRVFENFGR